MVHPLPGRRVTADYLARGRHWSCNRNAAGLGVHTGIDWGAPNGTWIVAARPGIVVHTRSGNAFGPNQFAVRFTDGTADFYAHTLDRPRAGVQVQAGQRIARVGALGNATGPHLHFEVWARWATGWNCTNHRNPQSSIAWQPGQQHGRIFLSRLRRGQRNSASVRFLQTHLNAHLNAGLPITGNYLDLTHASVQRCQTAHRFTLNGRPTDRVGPMQAAHLITRGCGCTITDDRANPV